MRTAIQITLFCIVLPDLIFRPDFGLAWDVAMLIANVVVVWISATNLLRSYRKRVS